MGVTTRFSWSFDNEFKNRDLNNDGDFDDPYEREEGYVVWDKDQPREVVNANWLDACIVFSPTGEAMFMEWNQYRRPFINAQAVIDGGFNERNRNGIQDRCAANDPIGSVGNCGLFDTSSPDRALDFRHPESQHFVAHNGGYYITLAPDAVKDGNDFDTVEEVLDSIDPTYRVFVGVSGVVKVIRVQRRRGGSFLDERETWPANPGDWQNDDLLKKNHEIGFLHKAGTVGNNKRAEIIGEPINLMVTGRMLTERVWWYND